MSKTKIILCIVGALLVHAVIITFGGILFLSEETVQSSRRDVELLNEDVQKDKDKVEEEKEVGDLIELKTDLQIFLEKHQQEIEVNPKKRKQMS